MTLPPSKHQCLTTSSSTSSRVRYREFEFDLYESAGKAFPGRILTTDGEVAQRNHARRSASVSVSSSRNQLSADRGRAAPGVTSSSVTSRGRAHVPPQSYQFCEVMRRHSEVCTVRTVWPLMHDARSDHNRTELDLSQA